MEVHSTEFDYFGVDVEVERDTETPDIRVKFTLPDSDRTSLLTLAWDDLREVIDFVAKHALGLPNAVIVGYDETLDSAKDTVQ